MASSKRSSSSADPKKEKLRKEIQAASETIATINTKFDHMELRQVEYMNEIDSIGRGLELTKPAKDKSFESYKSFVESYKSFEKKDNKDGKDKDKDENKDKDNKDGK